MENYNRSWTVLDLTPAIVLEAAHGVKNHQLGYWDAQIWATAKLNRIESLFTENMGTGSTLDGVSIINPLTAHFDFQTWYNGT